MNKLRVGQEVRIGDTDFVGTIANTELGDDIELFDKDIYVQEVKTISIILVLKPSQVSPTTPKKN